MKTILAFLMLVAAPMFAQTEYRESPYAGDLVEGSAKDGARFLLIDYKCGSGCADVALLFISYSGVKIVCSSILDKLEPQIKLEDYDGHVSIWINDDPRVSIWNIKDGKL